MHNAKPKKKTPSLTHDNNPRGHDQSVSHAEEKEEAKKKFIPGRESKHGTWPNLLECRAGDDIVHTYFHALPWYNCHANAATFLCLVWIVKFPFPCSFPGRKPKRRRGNPGSPLSGPNLLVLEYILNTLCKYYPRVWDWKLVNEASRQGSRVSPWP